MRMKFDAEMNKMYKICEMKQKRNFSREIFSALDDLKVNKKPSIYEVMGFKRRLDKTLDGFKIIFFLSANE